MTERASPAADPPSDGSLGDEPPAAVDVASDGGRKPLLIGLGLAFGAEVGLGIGAVVGLAFDELGLALALGAVFGSGAGIAAGATMGSIFAADRPEDRCLRCGYARRGLPGPVCPECGGRADRLASDSFAPYDDDDDDDGGGGARSRSV